jgi:hypothetical protein
VVARRERVAVAGWGDAFKNDPSYGPGGANAKKVVAQGPMAEVTFKTLKGEKTIKAPVGSPMAAAASKAGVKIAYNCKNGECGTCEVLLDGKKVIRTCQFKVPSGGCNIMTKN